MSKYNTFQELADSLKAEQNRKAVANRVLEYAIRFVFVVIVLCMIWAIYNNQIVPATNFQPLSFMTFFWLWLIGKMIVFLLFRKEN
jgi:hypothetical protein